MKKVFLGGTVNKSKWRDYVMPRLKIDYFNPVVEEWNDTAYEKELHERENCDFCLYVITPKMLGFYSIAEVADDSNKRPEKTIYCILEKDGRKTFKGHQKKSLDAVGKLIAKNGGKWVSSLDELVEYLNSFS
jgi:hypothetical protein